MSNLVFLIPEFLVGVSTVHYGILITTIDFYGYSMKSFQYASYNGIFVIILLVISAIIRSKFKHDEH
jgi:hypothetical protein